MIEDLREAGDKSERRFDPSENRICSCAEMGSAENGTRITHEISLQGLTSNNMHKVISCFVIDVYAALD